MTTFKDNKLLTANVMFKSDEWLKYGNALKLCVSQNANKPQNQKITNNNNPNAQAPENTNSNQNEQKTENNKEESIDKENTNNKAEL